MVTEKSTEHCCPITRNIYNSIGLSEHKYTYRLLEKKSDNFNRSVSFWLKIEGFYINVYCTGTDENIHVDQITICGARLS